MEHMPAIRDMKILSGALSWPYYLRNKTGAAEAFAFMLFPKEHNIDMTVYIQVIEDIGLFMNLANDILSWVSFSSRLDWTKQTEHVLFQVL